MRCWFGWHTWVKIWETTYNKGTIDRRHFEKCKRCGLERYNMGLRVGRQQ